MRVRQAQLLHCSVQIKCQLGVNLLVAGLAGVHSVLNCHKISVLSRDLRSDFSTPSARTVFHYSDSR